MDETPETYYWLGLLMSDGHFNKNGYITLSINDVEHTNKLRDYLDIEKSNKKLISISDKLTFKKLSEKFKITNNKTYEPCDLSKISNNDLLFSLIIGFIDGDGSINSKRISIVSHKNWHENLLLFNKIFKGKIYNDGELLRFNLQNLKYLKKIKQKAIYLNLPFLERKWDKIDLDRISKYEKREYCFSQFEKGLKPNEIIKLGVVDKCVYKYYSIYGEKTNLKLFNNKEKQEYCFFHFKNGVSINDIIEKGDVSRSCVYRNFKKYTRSTPESGFFCRIRGEVV